MRVMNNELRSRAAAFGANKPIDNQFGLDYSLAESKKV
jgi:hypothetical protein